MRAIRNFIYNFSDVFIAAIIIGLAALLIWTRINIIMDYPDSYGETLTAKIANALPFTSDKASDNGATNESTSTNPALDSGLAQTDDSSNSNQDSVLVTIPAGSSINAVASILHEAGILVNENDFTYQIYVMGMDGQIQYGTYTIPRGTSIEGMINILTKSGSDDANAEDANGANATEGSETPAAN